MYLVFLGQFCCVLLCLLQVEFLHLTGQTRRTSQTLVVKGHLENYTFLVNKAFEGKWAHFNMKLKKMKEL